MIPGSKTSFHDRPAPTRLGGNPTKYLSTLLAPLFCSLLSATTLTSREWGKIGDQKVMLYTLKNKEADHYQAREFPHRPIQFPVKKEASN